MLFMAEAPEVNDTSTCTICLGSFISPRILPCSHSFCELCIAEYIISTVTQPGQNTFNCPVCRNSVVAEDSAMDKSKWVSFLPLKLDPKFSKASNEYKKQFCYPCQIIEKHVLACQWCCDCNEALCRSCGDIHQRLKMSSTHKTVTINTEDDIDTEIDKLLQTTGEMCLIHEGRHIEMYCSDHAKEICILCLSADHRKCESLEMIDSLDDLKEESLFAFKSEIVKLLDAVKVLAEEETESKQELQIAFKSTETQSLGTITQLKMKLDDLYIEFLKKAGLQQDELQDELDQTLKSLSEYTTVLKEMIGNIELVSRYGSKVQLLRTTNDIKCNLGKLGKTLYPMLSNSSKYKVHGNFDPILDSFNDITKLGDISVSKDTRESTWSGDILKLQNLLIADSEVKFSNVSLTTSYVLHFPDKTVISSVHLDKNTCAVLTHDKLLLTSSEEILQSVPVAYETKKLCFDADKNILYGTCYNNSGFCCIVNGEKIEKPRNCSFEHMICGIDICNNTIYIATKNAVLQTKDFKHKTIWMVASLSGFMDDISFDKNSERFSFLAFEKMITFGNMSDKSLRPVQDNLVIRKPRSIAFGPSGMLFVAEILNSIRVISSDEKSVRTLLPKLQKIKDVSDITVSHDKKKLYVSGGNYVEIYDIVKDQTTK